MKDIFFHHQITLPDGSVTPGVWPPCFEEFGLTKIDFRGKRVLDIGCLDGLYSFYAEERGASEVVSIDNMTYVTSDAYLYAHKQRGSNVKYAFPFSVYDLSKEVFGQFDVVFFLGVIYHLIHPALALERINEVLKPGGTVAIDAEVAPRTAKFYHGSDVYKGDRTVYWVFDRITLEKLLDFAGFNVKMATNSGRRRATYVCEKVAEFSEGAKSGYTHAERISNFLPKER